MSAPIFDIPVNRITGEPESLEKYKGNVTLIVNVASKCGLTPQYEGLEKLYRDYRGRGLVVLGFPANDFGAQEPGTNDEIQSFCTTNFGVDFPMFEKIAVTGEGTHPLYQALIAAQPKAVAHAEPPFREKLKGYGIAPTLSPASSGISKSSSSAAPATSSPASRRRWPPKIQPSSRPLKQNSPGTKPFAIPGSAFAIASLNRTRSYPRHVMRLPLM